MFNGKQHDHKGWRCGPVDDDGKFVEPDPRISSRRRTWVQARSPPPAPLPSSRLILHPLNEQGPDKPKVVLVGKTLTGFCKANGLDRGTMSKVPRTDLARAMRQF